MKHLITAAFAAALMLSGPAHARFTGYLEVPDIAGESERIEVVDASFGPNALSAPNGSAGPGVANITLKRGYVSSDELWLWKRGDVIPKLTLNGRDDSGAAMTIMLENATVAKVASATGGGRSAQGTDDMTFTLNFEKITWRQGN